MRRYALQIGSVLILVVCLGSHVSEMFDHWDHTGETGNDIESSMVVLTLLAGAVLVLAHVAARTMRITVAERLPFLLANIGEPTEGPIACVGHSPPLTLRI